MRILIAFIPVLLIAQSGADQVSFKTTSGNQVTNVGAVLNSAFLYSTGYSTLALACAAANSNNKTLAYVNTFSNSPTQSLNCNIWVPSGIGAMIQPASGAVLTLASGRTITAPPVKIFDYSAGGTVVISGGATSQVFPQWWGVVGDDSTDNTTTMGYANAGSRNLFWPNGVYRFSTSPAIQLSANWTCAGNRTTVFRATGTHGLQFAAHTSSARNDTRISNCGFVADGAGTQDAVYAENVYGLYLDNPKAGLATYFGLSAISANSASVGYFVVDNTGTGNSAFISIIQPEIQGGSGSGIVANTATANGVAGLNIIGGEIHEVDRYAVEATGAGSGPHEIHATGGVYEGTGLGFLRLNWLNASYFTGIHFENGATAVVPIQLANGGVPAGVLFENNNIGCGTPGTHALKGIGFGATTARNVTIRNNVFTNCDTAVTLTGGANIDTLLASNRLVNTTKLYDYGVFALNVTNLCIQDSGLGNGCYTTTAASPATTQIGALNYIASETGANNAIKGELTMVSQLQGPGFNVFTDGMTVTIKLAHTLRIGANTFDLNPANSAGPRAIKSCKNVANDLATAWAVGGPITLRWVTASSVWCDISQ